MSENTAFHNPTVLFAERRIILMAIPFYAKAPDNQGYIKNMEVLGFSDLDKSSMFQMGIHKTDDGKYYLYGTNWGGTRYGVFINDVTNPTNPKYLKTLQLADPIEYPTTRCLKCQVADGLLIVSVFSGGGPGEVVDIDKSLKPPKCQNGVQIYSIKEDPENPKFLSYWDNGMPRGFGVHRFMYDGGNYVHLTSEAFGFEGFIYRILDISDLKNPIEIGRWWLPEQHAHGYAGREIEKGPSPSYLDRAHIHGPPFVRGDKCYLGCSGSGLSILDVSDLTRPKCIGQLKLKPPFSGGLAGSRTHTALPLPGRDLLVVTNEGERYSWFTTERIKAAGPQPLNNLHMIDISDPTNPTLIAEFPYPEVPESYPYKNFTVAHFGIQGPFGPHNIHEPMAGKPCIEQRGDRLYCCYFHAGMRVYDLSDEYYIKEIGYFIPPNPDYVCFPALPGPRMATTEDCVVDDRGNIFMCCLEDGLYVLRMEE